MPGRGVPALLASQPAAPGRDGAHSHCRAGAPARATAPGAPSPAVPVWGCWCHGTGVLGKEPLPGAAWRESAFIPGVRLSVVQHRPAQHAQLCPPRPIAHFTTAARPLFSPISPCSPPGLGPGWHLGSSRGSQLCPAVPPRGCPSCTRPVWCWTSAGGSRAPVSVQSVGLAFTSVSSLREVTAVLGMLLAAL